MNSALTGYPFSDLAPGAHLCCIYDNEDEHRAVLTPFLRQGLSRREKVLCVVDAHNAEVILGYLSDVGIDADACVASGQLAILTRSDVYFRNGCLDPDHMIAFLREETERALAEGWTALRGTAETTWALHGEPGSERLIEYEAKLNTFFPGSQCLALCQYDQRRFSPEVLLDVLHTHPAVIFGRELVDNPYYLSPEVFLSDLPSARFKQWADALLDSRRQRQERARSEEQFLSFAEAAQQVFWITDLQPERVIYVSPAFERIFHRSVDELKQNPRLWTESIHPDDRDAVTMAFDLWTSGEPGAQFDVTYRIVAADNQVHWITDRGIVLERDEGRVVRVGGIAEDVTERVRTTRTLEESERRYRDIFNHASDCLTLVEPAQDGDFRYLEVNPAYEQAIGIPRMQLIGRTRLEALEKEVAAKINANCSRCLEEGAIVDQVVELEVPAGRRTFQTTFIPVRDEAGRITRILGVNRDVTERLRAEGELRAIDRQFRTLMDSFPDFIARFDRDGRHLYVNRAVTRAFGVPPEDILGKTLRQLPPKGDPEQADSLLSGIKEAFECGLPNSLDVVWQMPGGDRHFEVRHVPELNERGGVLSVLGITRDITELKRAEQERQAHLRLLESLDQVNRAIQGTNDLEEMMGNVLDAVLSIFDCDRAWLFYPCDPDAPSFRVPMEVTKPEYPGAKALNVDLPMPSDMAQNLGEALESTDPVVYTSGTDRPINRVSAEQFGVKSMMMVALRPKRGEPWAFGLHHCSTPYYWTKEDQRLFKEIGRRLTDALTSLLTVRNLWESEGKLADAQSIAHVGHWDLDVEADRITGSAETFRILGVPQQGGPLKFDHFLQLVHPEDRHLVAAAASTAVGGSPPHEAEFRVVQPGGETRYIHSRWGVTKDDLGRPRHLFGTLQDITERRHLEEEMRQTLAAVEQAAEAIIITDPDGAIRYVNPAFTRVTGYSRDESVGRKPSILKSGRQSVEFYQELWATLGREEVWHGHFINRRKDGTLFEEDATISPVRDEKGHVVQFVAVKRDVTQEVALEAQLRQSQKMEAIGRLAGGIAHDFNNVLQAMLSVTQLLQMSPERAEGELAELEAQVLHGAALTRQLLLFSRREAARREHLDLSELIGEAVTFLRRLVRANVEVAVETTEGPVAVEADRGQLYQVLMNLAINAADAMPEGGSLAIRSGVTGAWAWFEVQDTGQGIPEEIRESIFDPFFTTKPAGRGTGLGLSVVHGIVTQHGGTIELETTEGEGTRFRVLLPSTEAAPESVPSPPGRGGDLPRGRGERVLIVEDEAVVRETLRALLTSLGHEVTAVGSRNEATQLPNLPEFEILLTDLMLPDATGDVLARNLLGRWPAMRVILMSGYGDHDVLGQGEGLEGVEVLQKPFDASALMSALRRVADAQQ
jgi:PAS domain S-box-containing protein